MVRSVAVPGAEPADERGRAAWLLSPPSVRGILTELRVHFDCAWPRTSESAGRATRADFDACVLLQRAVWGLSDLEITSAIQLIATTHAGGMLHVAEAAGRTGRGLRLRLPRPARTGVRAPALGHAGGAARVPAARRRRAPEVGPARGGARARHRPHHLDLRPAAGAQRPPEPAAAGGRGHRVPRELLRHHHLVAAPRPAHRPAAGALGPELGRGCGGSRPRASASAHAWPAGLAAHQRREVAGRLAGLVGAPPGPGGRPSCCSRSRRNGT